MVTTPFRIALGAGLIVFPECYVPGYRAPHKHVPPPDQAFLDRAWKDLAAACAKAKVAAVVGTERVVDSRAYITALVIDASGTQCGFQDKVQRIPRKEPSSRRAPGAESSVSGR